MPAIPLSQGGVVLVSDQDVPLLEGHSWYLDSNGYATARIGGHKTYLHRFLLGLERGNPLVADHINRNRLDNRRENLRAVTRKQNRHNLPAHRGSTSRYRGVCWDKNRRQWAVSIKLKDGGRYFARYVDEDEAGRAAEAKRREMMSHAVD